MIDDGFESRAQCACHSHSGFSSSDCGADQLHPAVRISATALGEGFGSIGNPKLHPLRDLEVAQFVASGRVRL